MYEWNRFDYRFAYVYDYGNDCVYDYSFDYGYGCVYDYSFGNRKGPHKQS